MARQEIKLSVFAERLSALMTATGETVYTIADKLSLTPSTISRYSNGIMAPKVPTLYALASLFGVNPLWLMGYDGAPKYTMSNNDDIFSLPGIEPPPRWVKKPLLGSIACGVPILAVENIEDYILVPEDIHCDFLLRCKGDSMINARIMDGDIVMIRHQEDVENGEIAAVRIDGEVTLKRVYKHPGMVQLMPENSAYPPMIYNNGNCSEICIVGKAIAFLSLVR